MEELNGNLRLRLFFFLSDSSFFFFFLLPCPQHDQLLKEAESLPSLTLNDRHLCDLEMILSGAFSPLEGFLNEDDFNSVVEDMRLKNGLLWPIPITLEVDEAFTQAHKVGSRVALRDPRDDQILAIWTGE